MSRRLSKSALGMLVFPGLLLLGEATVARASDLQGQIDRLDRRKKTVCSITINSSEERDLFKDRLNADHFNFIELVPEAGETNNENWFRQACRSGLKCDLLLVSGHFAGAFFGESGYHLSLEEIEERACNSDCGGILNNPKEVFLFGCNTLAGKRKDSRTPEQYINVLVQDGFSRAQAEQVAAFRYSPIGSSNEDRMRMAFKGAGKIYGFDSIGPSGKNVEGMLSSYLSSVKDYRSHLDRVNPASPNKVLASALKSTAFREVSGFELSLRDPVCYLNDPKISGYDKAVWLRRVVDNSSTTMMYASHISKYLMDLENQQFRMEDRELKVFEEISRLDKTRSTLEKAIDTALKGMLNVQISVTNIMRSLAWWDDAKYRSEIQELIGSQLTADISPEKAELLCSLDVVTRLKLSDFQPDPSKWSANYMEAVGCLRPQDQDLHLALLKVATQGGGFQAVYAENALVRIGAHGLGYLAEVLRIFETATDIYKVKTAGSLLRASQSRNVSLHTKLIKILRSTSDEHRAAEAAQVLRGWLLDSGEAQRLLAEVIATTPSRSALASGVLRETGLSDREAEKLLIGLLGSANSRDSALQALKSVLSLDEDLELMLVDVIKSADPAGKAAAADVLMSARLRGPSARQSVLSLIQAPYDQATREAAARLLGVMPTGDPALQLVLAQVLLKDPSDLVRQNVSETFTSYPPASEEVQLLLLERLKDETNTFVSMFVGASLAETTLSPAAIQKIKAMIANSSSERQKADLGWLLEEQAKKKKSSKKK